MNILTNRSVHFIMNTRRHNNDAWCTIYHATMCIHATAWFYLCFKPRSPHSLIKWSCTLVPIFTGNGPIFHITHGPVKSQIRVLFSAPSPWNWDKGPLASQACCLLSHVSALLGPCMHECRQSQHTCSVDDSLGCFTQFGSIMLSTMARGKWAIAVGASSV